MDENEKGHLMLVSQILAFIQLIAGILAIVYMIKIYADAGILKNGIRYMTPSMKAEYSGIFVYFCGLGILHIFAAGCILSREKTAPLFAILSGSATFVLQIHSLMKQQDYPVFYFPLLAALLFYVIWFIVNRGQFENKNTPE